MNDDFIMERLREHYNEVKEHYAANQILGVFLYGSQNYNLATAASDVDTKAIIIPTLKDLCLRQPVSRELHLDNEEHCEVKDIREMVKMYKKQNINFIETLFTNYSIVNNRYNDLWEEYFIQNREDIARIDPRQTILSITGQILSQLSKKPFDEKVFANNLRLYYFLLSYLAGKPYKECLNIESQGKTIATKIRLYRMGEIKIKREDVNNLSRNVQSLITRVNQYDLLPNQDTINTLNEGIIKLVERKIR